MNKYALRQTPLAAAITCIIASGSTQAATITVNTANDTIVASECSLRAAIQSANAATAIGGCDSGSTGADEIVFDQSLAESTISIGSPISIENSLSISGPGPELLTIDTDSKYNNDGMFHVDFSSNPDQELSIHGLTLNGGNNHYYDGGAIRMQTPGPGHSATLTLEDMIFVDNYSYYDGGAIAFRTHDCGGLTVRNSLMLSNSAYLSGGAIHFEVDADCLLSIENSLLTNNHSDSKTGGAVYAYSYLDLQLSVSDNSLLAFNQALYDGGGLALVSLGGGEISIRDSQLAGNVSSYGYGGGMSVHAPYAYDGTGFQLEIDNSLIRGNHSGYGYGASGGGLAVLLDNGYGTSDAAVTITDSHISGNTGSTSSIGGGGAGLILRGADLTISGSQFENNSAYAAGGLFVNAKYGGSLTISDSKFLGNMGTILGGLAVMSDADMFIERTVVHDNLAAGVGGGAVYSDDELVVRDSEFSANTGVKYGGMLLYAGSSLLVENTTISGNTSQTGGGAFLYGDKVSARFLTVADNTTSLGGGSGKYGSAGSGLMVASSNCEIDHSLLALNTGPSGPADLYAPDCDVSWSLIGESASSAYIDAGDNLVDINPVIGPLADNGGPTRTHALGATSPAINRGNPAFISPPDFDQRGPGFPRVFGGIVDIGAYELQGEPEDLVFSDRFEEP